MTCEILDSGSIMCGSFPPLARCDCGKIADYLCDFPKPRSGTCSKPLCGKHKIVKSIGPDGTIDYCPQHADGAIQVDLFAPGEL